MRVAEIGDSRRAFRSSRYTLKSTVPCRSTERYVAFHRQRSFTNEYEFYFVLPFRDSTDAYRNSERTDVRSVLSFTIVSRRSGDRDSDIRRWPITRNLCKQQRHRSTSNIDFRRDRPRTTFVAFISVDDNQRRTTIERNRCFESKQRCTHARIKKYINVR